MKDQPGGIKKPSAEIYRGLGALGAGLIYKAVSDRLLRSVAGNFWPRCNIKTPDSFNGCIGNRFTNWSFSVCGMSRCGLTLAITARRSPFSSGFMNNDAATLTQLISFLTSSTSVREKVGIRTAYEPAQAPLARRDLVTIARRIRDGVTTGYSWQRCRFLRSWCRRPCLRIRR